MKILLDECVPKRLKHHLDECEGFTMFVIVRKFY